MNENWDKNEFEKSPSGHGLGEDKWVSDEYFQYPEFFLKRFKCIYIYIPCLCHDARGKFPLLSERDRNEIIVYEHWVSEFGNVLEIIINLRSLKC